MYIKLFQLQSKTLVHSFEISHHWQICCQVFSLVGLSWPQLSVSSERDHLLQLKSRDLTWRTWGPRPRPPCCCSRRTRGGARCGARARAPGRRIRDRESSSIKFSVLASITETRWWLIASHGMWWQFVPIVYRCYWLSPRRSHHRSMQFAMLQVLTRTMETMEMVPCYLITGDQLSPDWKQYSNQHRPTTAPASRPPAPRRQDSHWTTPSCRRQSERSSALGQRGTRGSHDTIFIYEEITVVYHYCNWFVIWHVLTEKYDFLCCKLRSH